MKRKTPRLKKGPECCDYVVESIEKYDGRYNKAYDYFISRAGARAYAKGKHITGVRVRVFHISYRLVSDSK